MLELKEMSLKLGILIQFLDMFLEKLANFP